MDVLPFCFRTLSYCGLWLEENSSCAFFRKCWGLFVVSVIFYFTFVELIEFYLLRSNFQDLVDIMVLTVTYIVLCLKILNFGFQRKGLLELLEKFRIEICQPRSLEEENILSKYYASAAKMFKNILGLSQVTGVFFCVLPFATLPASEWVVPFKTYQFYDDSVGLGFWITCAIQFMALVFGIFLNVSMDTMIYGFIILATGQFELMSHRILKPMREEEEEKLALRECISHHVHMRKTVRQIQQVFITVIAPLFFLSLLTLCASIFQMSKNDLISLEFFGFTMYLSCMLFQVFLYCWYGNELKIKSQDLASNIYETDWTVSDLQKKKAIYILMLSAEKGCSISLQGQCPLSVETFVAIMKASYSAFNVLQQASYKA